MLDDADWRPLEELAEHRQRRWSEQSRYVAERSDLLRRLWGGGSPPDRLTDLGDLPLVDKATLRAAQQQHPPYGDYLAASPVRIRRVHRTGGTTGQAMNLALSAGDADQTARVGARAQVAAGLRPGDVVAHCLNYQLWMGGYTDHATLEAAGATVVPFGVGNPELLIRTIFELRITALSCTPSYPAVLEHVIADRFPDLAPRDLGLRLGLFGGEAALDVPGFRERLERVWGFAARNANYGVTDVMCNLAGQCEAQPDLHFVALDVLHPEIVAPDTGAPLPWEPGTTGELVLTHVERECQPLVRFRTGDLVVLTATAVCACGRTAPRFRVVGRSDDMVVIRGVNVFPTAVAAVVTADPDLSGEYRIVLDGPGPYDRLPLEVELADHAVDADPHAVEARVRDAVHRDLRASATVRVRPPRSLPRTEGKSRRVVRREAPA
jgi:phenylacetate-CoA ligase